MKITKYFILLILTGASFVSPLFAKTVSYPAISASISPDYAENCSYDTSGAITGIDDSSGCILYFPISIPNGSTLNTVKLFYYDNSGELLVWAELNRNTMATSSHTNLDFECVSTDDVILSFCNHVYTDTDVQDFELTYGEKISESYSYELYVLLGYGTKISSISIDYD